jgi:hypothetical protein
VFPDDVTPQSQTWRSGAGEDSLKSSSACIVPSAPHDSVPAHSTESFTAQARADLGG